MRSSSVAGQGAPTRFAMPLPYPQRSCLARVLPLKAIFHLPSQGSHMGFLHHSEMQCCALDRAFRACVNSSGNSMKSDAPL